MLITYIDTDLYCCASAVYYLQKKSTKASVLRVVVNLRNQKRISQ